MPEKITFSGVRLLSFSRSPKKGGIAKFRCSLTESICEKLDWPAPDERLASAVPETILHVHHMELIPKDKEFRKWALELTAQKVASFNIIRRELEGKKGKGFRHELQFDVTFGDTLGCAKLEDYMMNIGAAKAGLVIQFNEEKQQTLPGTRVDMTPEDSDLPPLLTTEGQRAAVAEIPVGEGQAPTHAEKVKQRQEEERRKQEAKEAQLVQ